MDTPLANRLCRGTAARYPETNAMQKTLAQDFKNPACKFLSQPSIYLSIYLYTTLNIRPFFSRRLEPIRITRALSLYGKKSGERYQLFSGVRVSTRLPAGEPEADGVTKKI